MGILKNNPELEQLELAEEWNKARDLVYTKWINEKMDLDNLLRVGTECWYVLVFWERIDSKGLKRADFSGPLTEVKNFGLSFFKDSDTFNWIFGYMIKLFPYWFGDFDGDYDGWQNMGSNMVKLASEQNPNNRLAKMLSLSENSKDYNKISHEVKTNIDYYFSSNTEIERYFRRVLGNKYD
jgi:hypothetical protein